MDIINAMRIFRRVVELQNFTAVSRELNMAQPTVSKYISALENHLDVILFSRNTRQLNVTDAGQEYYIRCCQILEDLENAEASIRDQKAHLKGVLRVNAPVSFGREIIAPHVWNFMKKYPDLSVDFTLDDSHIDLVREGVDLTIRSGIPLDSQLISQKICDVERLTVASSNYLKTLGKPKNLEDLRSHQCIIYTGQVAQREWVFTKDGNIEKVNINGRLRVNSPEASINAAVEGIGVSVSPRWLANKYIKAGALEVILEAYSPVSYQVNALYPTRKHIPRKTQAFISYLRENVKGVHGRKA